MRRALPLHVEGALDLRLPGGSRRRLDARGAELVLELDRFRSLRALLQLRGAFERVPLRAFEALSESAGVTFEARLRGATFLRMGPGVRSSLLARLFGLPAAELRLLPVLAGRPRR